MGEGVGEVDVRTYSMRPNICTATQILQRLFSQDTWVFTTFPKNRMKNGVFLTAKADGINPCVFVHLTYWSVLWIFSRALISFISDLIVK